jgi:hypothetical protein
VVVDREAFRRDAVVRADPRLVEALRVDLLVVARRLVELRAELLRLEVFALGDFAADRLRVGLREVPLLALRVEVRPRFVDLRVFLRPGLGRSQDDAMAAS